MLCMIILFDVICLYTEYWASIVTTAILNIDPVMLHGDYTQ